MKCPKCGSEQCVKAGFNHNRQRYKCKKCRRQITQIEDKNATKRAFALYLYAVGLSLTFIGQILKVEPSTIMYWVKNFTFKTCKISISKSEWDIIILDVMQRFLRLKKTKSEFERRTVELPANLLLENTENESPELEMFVRLQSPNRENYLPITKYIDGKYLVM
jgi:hypothetical protein